MQKKKYMAKVIDVYFGSRESPMWVHTRSAGEGTYSSLQADGAGQGLCSPRHVASEVAPELSPSGPLLQIRVRRSLKEAFRKRSHHCCSTCSASLGSRSHP